MIKTISLILIAMSLTACAGNKYAINEDKEKFEQWVMDRRVDTVAVVTGPFCHGKKVVWYHENERAYYFSCQDGGTFTVPKD